MDDLIVSSGRVGRRRPYDYIGVVAVALLGYFSLWVPWTGDPALFGTAARTLNDGGTYLRDFWDIKQPGIYWFYQAADRLTGPLWLPSRVMTALWLVGLALLVLHVAAATVKSLWLRRLSPLIVVGPLLLTGGSEFLGVPENLIGLPLLGSAVLLAHGLGNRRFRAPLVAAAGAVGAVALLLKLPYVLVLAVFVVAAILGGRRNRLVTGAREAAKVVGWFSVGLAIPLSVVVAQSIAQGQLSLLLATTFGFPPAISALGTLYEYSYYIDFMKAGLWVLAPWAVLCGLAIPLWRKLPTLLVGTALAWAATTVVIIAIQKPNPYQTHALLVPLGLVVLWVLDALIDVRAGQGARWETVVAITAIAGAVLGWVFLPYHGSSRASFAVEVVRAGGVPNRDALLQVALGSTPEFAKQEALADSAPGPADSLFVLGHPLLYVLLDQRQAIEINGWSPEFAVPAQWSETERELRRTRPGLVAVDDFSMPYLVQGAPGIVAFLDDQYTETDVPELGITWFSRIDPDGLGPVPPTPEGNLLAWP